MKTNNEKLNIILRKLDSLNLKIHFINSLKGVYQFFTIFLSACFLTLLLETIFRFSPFAREIIFYSSFLIFAVLFVFLVLYDFICSIKFLVKPDYNRLAEKAGGHFNNIKDDLLNSIQLLNSKDKFNKSGELIELAFNKVYEKVSGLNFNEAVNLKGTKKYLRVSLVTFAAFIILLFAFPDLYSASIRIAQYDKTFTPPQEFYFEVSPGSIDLTKGKDVEIKIKPVGKNPGKTTLKIKQFDESDFKDINILPDSLNEFSYKINPVKNSFQYYAKSGSVLSNIFTINVVNRPIVKTFDVEIINPSYSKLGGTVQKDNGNITALPGSRVNITLTSSKTLGKAEIIFSDSSITGLDINDKTATVKLYVNKNVDYHFKLTDSESITSENPITYSIKTIVDNYPVLEIISPNGNVKLKEQDQINIVSKISDDYGFSKLTLNYKLTASLYEQPWEEFKQKNIVINKDLKEDEAYYNWDLRDMNLATEDVVSYYLELFDNDIVGGPKSVKSKLFTITIPSLDELFNEADAAQEIASKNLEETLKEANRLKDELKNISDELKKDEREITFEEKEKLEKALEKFNELGEKVKDIQKELNEMQKKLRENNLLSEETMEKYMELQELMDEFAGEDFKKAMEKLQQALNQLKRNDVQSSLEDLKNNEEYFKKSIERTINLLKRIQVEQKIDEMIKRTESILEKQNELTDETKNKNEPDDNLSQKQEDITRDLESYKEQLENLKEKMSELSDMPNEQMKQTESEFNEQNNQELSNQAQQNIENMQFESALQKQEQLTKNMNSMMGSMESLQQQMQMQNQMQVMQDMMKIIDNVLSLSKEQEALKEETKTTPPNSPELNEKTQEQNNIQNNLSKILQQMSSLSQKTFAMTPEMGKAIGKSLQEMRNSIEQMQNGNKSIAFQNQEAAMAGLNEAALMMRDMMNNMMNGGGSGGMMSMMQQLQQMSQQQMNLNQLTQQLQQGQFSHEQMAQLQRLARQQELIQKSLSELNKETKQSGESKKLTSNLEKIIEEMKEVATNMKTQKLDDDLLLKQERILSKLLDAQRSINERDFEERRESITGKEFLRDSPPDVILSNEESKDKLKEELLKAIKEGYLKDYEELIRKYYQTLQENNQ
ncbi:MAG: hypothetical protein PVH88_11425 [Ignavibacteria bacterium]|jgi:hypothetical protein